MLGKKPKPWYLFVFLNQSLAAGGIDTLDLTNMFHCTLGVQGKLKTEIITVHNDIRKCQSRISLNCFSLNYLYRTNLKYSKEPHSKNHLKESQRA